MTRASVPSVKRAPRIRRYLRKANSLVHAAQAIASGPISGVRHLQAAPDFQSKWHVFVTSESRRAPAPILTPEYSIHFVTGSRAMQELEAARIRSFYSYLNRAGVYPRVIVSGTAHGPDAILRLRGGSLAIVEIRGRRGFMAMAPVLRSRYSYLLDHFTLFFATQSDHGHWALYRFRDNTFEPVEPEVLSG